MTPRFSDSFAKRTPSIMCNNFNALFYITAIMPGLTAESEAALAQLTQNLRQVQERFLQQWTGEPLQRFLKDQQQGPVSRIKKTNGTHSESELIGVSSNLKQIKENLHTCINYYHT